VNSVFTIQEQYHCAHETADNGKTASRNTHWNYQSPVPVLLYT